MGRDLPLLKDAVSALLQKLDAAGPNELMPVLLDALARAIGATSAALLMADVEERVLERWPGLEADTGEESPVPMDGSAHGEAYRTGVAVRTEIDGAPAVIAPVSARREREGVVEVRLEEPPTPQAEAVVEKVGVVLGYFINAADGWTDEFHLARRTREMALAAEIQWGLLPLRAFSSSRISLAGALEPAYDVGGDSFDYNCGLRSLTAGVFDAMGHGLGAARLSSLGVTAVRNARRGGADMVGQARFVHQLLREGFGTEGFMTGLLVSVDLGDPRRSRILAAGHPMPLLQRGDERPVEVRLAAHIPFGMPFDDGYASEELELLPGDRLALFSDGVVDARSEHGTAFGIEGLAAELDRLRAASPREAARKVVRAVRKHRDGDLTDDATILIVDIPR